MSQRAASMTMGLAVGALLAASVAAQGAREASAVRGDPPKVTVKTLPDFWGEYAIWGSSGVDRRGHIWLGITSNDDGSASAHLFEYDPGADTVTDRGNVIEQLQKSGLKRPDEKQMKIHSRIVQMPDGYLYFSSMDESGEAEDGSKPPTWGGHLWRLARPGVAWEHLARVPEALIAVAGGGSYVYSLGYWNHVLYQFDTRTKKVRSVTVGSVAGHISRNFFVDDRGHAYVPRLKQTGDAKDAPVDVTLVEFAPDLTEVASSPLPEYLERSPSESHGIVAVHPDGAGGFYFASGKGRLYHAVPHADAPATVTDLGWYHPGGSRYVASMFRDEATGVLFGAATASSYGGQAFEWVARTPGGGATVAPLRYGDAPQFPHAALVYGSMTRDALGRMYLVGTMNYKPVVLQVGAGAPAAK